MIGRRTSKTKEVEVAEPKGFDDFELRLGDVMRGERATMGKSLLDVQRELRIKASYIAAIENCDPEAFDTPGFIAGYVRSYARYLNMDPDRAFSVFCTESGFSVAHGMSAEASVVRKPSLEERMSNRAGKDIFAAPATPFIPTGEALFARVEPGAIGSMMVLVGLIGAIGYGGWSVLQEVQRVQVAPVDQTPVVLSDIDPLAGASGNGQGPELTTGGPSLQAPRIDDNRSAALDRLYRPQALDVPVLVSRDAPIATIDPQAQGAFADATSVETALLPTEPGVVSPRQSLGQGQVPQVVEDLGPTVRMVAAYPSWVRVRSAEGNTLFEGIMAQGDTYDIPATEVAPKLRTGESGAIYFAMGTDCYGPVGSKGSLTKGLDLDRAKLATLMAPVNPEDANDALNRMFADLDVTALPNLPCQTN